MVKNWQKLSVLIAGCGSIGKRHANVLKTLGLSDLWICDSNRNSLEELSSQLPNCQNYRSYESALADKPDAVFICTPSHIHIPMITAAVENNIHVMCEKPISTTVDGIDELDKLAKQKNVKVMIGLCFRFHEGILKAREYLNMKQIGRIISIRSIMGEYLPEIRADYKSLHDSNSPGAFDLMHDLDLALWMADSPVKKCHCIYGNYSDIGIKAPDLVEFLIDFQDSCTASVHLDFFHRPRCRQFDMICTGGMIQVEFSRWDQCTVSVYNGDEGTWRHEKLSTDRDDMFKEEDMEFLHSITEDRPIRCTIEEARKSVEVIELAKRRRV